MSVTLRHYSEYEDEEESEELQKSKENGSSKIALHDARLSVRFVTFRGLHFKPARITNGHIKTLRQP